MKTRDTFAELYFSDEILSIVKELVGLQDDPQGYDKLVMELFNLLVSPAEQQDFELCWHRDDVRPDVSPEEEERQLKEKSPNGRQLHAQYNIALFFSSSQEATGVYGPRLKELRLPSRLTYLVNSWSNWLLAMQYFMTATSFTEEYIRGLMRLTM